MSNENNISRIDKDYSKEKEIILEEYLIKFQLKQVSDTYTKKENIIVISAKKHHNNELFIYERILKFKDFQSFGELFQLCRNIEDGYEILLNLVEHNTNKIEIQEIDYENFINLSLKSSNIKLLRRYYNNEEIKEIIENYQKNNNELKEENNELKEENREIKEENNELKEEYYKMEERLKEKDKRINEIEKQLEEKNQKIKELKKKYNKKEERIQHLFKKYLYEQEVDFYDENDEYDENDKNDDKEISLFNACENENENLVKILIELGANINEENEY
eukprot:jgi/Orpsp1_1/1185590/evm.model.c7180000094509.1